MNFVATVRVDCKDFEFFFEQDDFNFSESARQAVAKSGMKVPYKQEQFVNVTIDQLIIKDGVLQKNFRTNCSVKIPQERINNSQYEQELEELLNKIPEEFRSFVSRMSWEDGHSAGLEEVLSIADDLVDGLLPCIEKFKKLSLINAQKKSSKK